MRLKINPKTQLRILACSLCGEWLSTRTDSSRGFGQEAIDHIIEYHPHDYKESLHADPEDREEFWTGAFYIYTERHFTPTFD